MDGLIEMKKLKRCGDREEMRRTQRSQTHNRGYKE